MGDNGFIPTVCRYHRWQRSTPIDLNGIPPVCSRGWQIIIVSLQVPSSFRYILISMQKDSGYGSPVFHAAAWRRHGCDLITCTEGALKISWTAQVTVSILRLSLGLRCST
jgi:hypothetical protein